MKEIIQLQFRHIPFFNSLSVAIINFIVFTLLVTVYNHNKFKDKKSFAFLFMSIFMLTWVDFAYLARLFGLYPQVSLGLLKIAWFASPMLFYLTYLVSMYISYDGNFNKKLNKLIFVITLLIAFINTFTSLVISGVKFTNNTLDIIYGPLTVPILIVILVLMFLTLGILYKSKPARRSTSFLIGVIVFYIANLIFNIALPVFFGISYLYYFGDYSSILLLGFTTYAIVKDELFDIKVIATEILIALIWFILIIQILLSQSSLQRGVNIFTLFLMVVAGIFLLRSVLNEVKQRQNLAVLNEKLKALDKQKDEFVSMAAHELRAPMTAIKGYISMVMEGDTGDIPEKARGFLADANAINERLIRLVNNMLNVSRIEEGRMVYQMEKESLSQVVRSVYSQFIPEAERKGLKLELKIDPEIKDTVYADVDRIHEVVSNLMSNAVKYTDQGEVEIKLIQPNPSFVRCEVKDTGRGISEAEQGRLFNKFYRAETNVGKTIGTGLGLYICKLLIEKFNGKIGLKSQVGKGSTFWFELPVADGDVVNK